MSREAVKPMIPEIGYPPPIWLHCVEQARDAFRIGGSTECHAAIVAIRAILEAHSGELGRGGPTLRLYISLLKWRLNATYERPFARMQAAQVQLWELEEIWPDVIYLRRFIEDAISQYGMTPGFKIFNTIFNAVDPANVSKFLEDPSEDFQIYRRPGAKLTIVGFSGLNHRFAGVGWNSFDQTVAHKLNANLIIVRDRFRRLYLNGIESMGDYARSVTTIGLILEEFKDTRVVAAGGSGGVFGAINIACDLDIRYIVAFGGPTSLEIGEESEHRQVYNKISADIAAGLYERPDLASKINTSKVERIDFFVAGRHEFDFQQMQNLSRQCACVAPHVYSEEEKHVVTHLAIADGTILRAFKSKGIA